MRKRTKFKSPVLDFFVVAVCLSVAGYFALTFWNDLNSTVRRTDKDEIAIITFKNRIAQRKFDDRVVWERIDKSTPLYNGDLVRTADLAEAVITFNDGSQVDIYENTMIQVYYSDFAGVQISVGNGKLQADSSNTGKLQLTMNDGSTVNAGGGASISAKATGKNNLDTGGAASGTTGIISSGFAGRGILGRGAAALGLGTGSGAAGSGSGDSGSNYITDGSTNSTIEVRSGSATVTGTSGETQAIEAGQSVNVKVGSEISKKPVTVTSIPPELRVLNIGEDTVPVKIEWNKIKFDEPVILQTSTRKDFSVITEEKILMSENDSLISLSEGTLYWRVFPKGDEEEASEGKISVETTKALTLVSPAPDGVLQYLNRNPEVTFRWNGNKYAQNYLIKVSSTPDMKTEVASKIVETTYAQINNLGSGQYWWQVTPYYELSSLGYADAGASNVSAFSIERLSGINPPSLTIPLQNASLTYKENEEDEENQNLDIVFSWKSELKANYDLIIARDRDFTDVIAIRHTAGQRITVNLAAPEIDGQAFYWKIVRNSSELEDKSPESLVRTFTISKYKSTPAKLLYPPEEYVTENTKLPAVRFMWKPADDAKSKDSIVQISNSPDFSSVKFEKTVEGTTLENVNIPYGEYFWRVATLDREGNLEYTQPNHLVVQQMLEAPVITNLKDNTEVLIAKDSAVRINWATVEGADYYNVKIYDENNNLVAENPEATGNTTSFYLADNTYKVKMQAVASQTEVSPIRTGPMESVDFSVRTPTSVTALTPYQSQYMDGLTALRTPVNFTWRDGSDKTASQEFILKKRQADGTLKVVERTKVTKNQISLSRLSSGSYTWQISASTKEGIPIDSQEVSFTITNVVALTTPELTVPSKNFVMESTFLRKNRSISFEWNAVSGATEYSFVLYRKGRNGSLTPVYSEKGIKGTKLKFKKLSSLDVGEFVWNVTAFSYQRDGFEERRSLTAAQEFKIDIPSPIQIKTEDTGRMYSAE